MALPTYARIRDSAVLFALVVMGIYALSLVLELVSGRVGPGRAGWTIALAGTLFLLTIGLGFLLYRMDKHEPSS